MSELRHTGTSVDPLSGDRIGDYEVEGLIARGGMASVLAARDVRDGHPVALKLLLPRDRPGEDGHGRFRREFRSLARLQHPNVMRVFESGLHRGRPWYSMERLDGHDLRVEAEQLAVLPTALRYARVEAIATQLARALAYVHDRGLIHRDVTPANVMVLEGTSVEAPVVKLMDFGVVKDAEPDLTADGELVGTVAYMAPEQISGAVLDPRADLYSLGAVLYLLLTGKRPFSAHTTHGYLEKHLHALPRPPHELAPGVPAHLEEICLRLLAKAPADRFASATHLLYVLGDQDPTVALGGGWPPSTVGRTPLRARLRDAIDEVANGRTGQAILLSGAPGLGKTRLIELAERAARQRGLPVAIGRCRPQDRPFGAFMNAYQVFDGANVPSLRAVFEDETSTVQIERYPVFAALREQLVARAPFVLVVDDLEDADPATVELLVYLIRNTLELASEPALFLLGHQTGSGERTREILAELQSVYVADLPPLDALEVEELVVSVLGSDPAALALAERLQRDGAGSPAFIADMIRSLIEDQVIVRDAGGRYRLTVDASQISQSSLPMPASLRQALRDRLQPLSADAWTIGRLLALSRRQIELDVIVSAAPISEERVMVALDELVDARIIAEHHGADGAAFELEHGRFREVLVDDLPDPEREPIHRRLGESLEEQFRRQIGTVVEELAYQFERARIWPKAYAYLVDSAQRHLKRSLHQEALVRLERALSIEPQARVSLTLEDADRRLTEVWLATSRARYALGLSDGDHAATPPGGLATNEAQRLARLVADPRLEAQVATELGLQLRRQGRPDEAEVQLRTAIARAEASGDQTLLPPALYEVGVTRWSRGDLNEAEQHWRRALQVAQQVGDERSQGQGYNGLAILASCRGQPIEARRLLEQSAAVFERLGMLGHLVVSWSNLLELYANTGVLRKAQSLSERMLSHAREVSLIEGIVLGYTWRARVMLQLGRFDEAEQDAAAAVNLLPRLANREDEPTVLGTAVMVALERRAAADVLRRVQPLLTSLDSYDPERVLSEARAWRAWALARLGQVEAATAEIDAVQIRPDTWPHVQVRTDLAVGLALLALGRTDPARDMFQRALQISEANGFRWFQLVAHGALIEVAGEGLVRDRHQRVAQGIARSLAANLPSEDAERFLASRGVEPG